VLVCPPEEMIWTKAFVMERERFDGADVNHLIRHEGHRLDWDRLVSRFGPYWRVLFAHLVLFGFVYPQHQDLIPRAVLRRLARRLDRRERGANGACFGTLLS